MLLRHHIAPYPEGRLPNLSIGFVDIYLTTFQGGEMDEKPRERMAEGATCGGTAPLAIEADLKHPPFLKILRANAHNTS